MTGFANKLNEPFSAGSSPQQGGTVSGAIAPTTLAGTSSNPRTGKNSIHDLEAWLPVRRTTTDAKTSVPAACIISANPVPESIANAPMHANAAPTQWSANPPKSHADSAPKQQIFPTTQAPTRAQLPPSVAAPSTVLPDREAPATLGSGHAPSNATPDNATPATLGSSHAAQQAQAQQPVPTLNFLDIPPLECKTVFGND